MKSVVFIPLLFVSICVVGQITIKEIEDKGIQERVRFLKAKTDSFLFSKFPKAIIHNFKFEFTQSGFFMGEMRVIYQFLNSKKMRPMDINSSTHAYSFFDKQINLKTSLEVNVYQDKFFDIQFHQTTDSLKFLSLNEIYNKGLLQKILTRIKESKFKQYYTEIKIDSKSKTFNIILKDKVLPHKYFIL